MFGGSIRFSTAVFRSREYPKSSSYPAHLRNRVKVEQRTTSLTWGEVDANLRRGEPLWRETGDGHGTTLIVTDAGLLAIGIEPVVVKTVAAIREHASVTPEAKQPTQRAGTKQALLIAMLRAPEGATMEAIIAATQWQAHTARGAMSGALGKKLGLVVTSEQDAIRGRVYRLPAA